MDNSLYKSLIHQTAILKQLDAFRVSGRFCDVTVGAGGKTFKCHRVLLAASSSYFESLFLLGQQMHSDYVTFVPLVSASSFEEILRFIYMAEFTISPENADDLLEAATMLRIQPMVEAITHYSRSFREGAAVSGASAPHTEPSSKRGQNEAKPSQNEGTFAKKARLDDNILPTVGQTTATHGHPSVSTQLPHSRDRQLVSDTVYPEACYLTDTSPNSQYDQGATITIKREREDPGYDAAACKPERPTSSAGKQRKDDTDVPVGPDTQKEGRVQWAINKQPLYHDGSRSVLMRKENQSGAESAEGNSCPTFRRAVEQNPTTHGQIFQEHLTGEEPGNIKLEAPSGMVTAGKNGELFDLQGQHGLSTASDRGDDSFQADPCPSASNTDGSPGQAIGMSAAELLKTLSRRYECAKHQQEITDTEVQGTRPSPRPKDDENSDSPLFSSWLEEAHSPQAGVQKLPSKKKSKKQPKKQIQKVGPDTSQLFAPGGSEHHNLQSETRPAQGSDQSKTRPAQGSDRSKTRPAQGSDRSETRPAQGSDRSKTRPAQGSDRSKTRPAQGSDRSETRPAQGSDRRAVAAAVGPTLAALLESPASSSAPDAERAAWTGVSAVVQREPVDQYRQPLRLGRGSIPQYRHGGSSEVFGPTDKPCDNGQNSQGGIAQPHGSKITTSPNEPIPRPRRAVPQSRKSMDKILTRLLTRDSYRDTEGDLGSDGNVTDAAGEEWAGVGASQTLRSMCGEYLTTLPQRRTGDSGISTIEVHKEATAEGRHATLMFPQSTVGGGVLGSTSSMASSVGDGKVKYWASSDKLSSDKEPRVSLKDTPGTPRSGKTQYSCTDLPARGTDQSDLPARRTDQLSAAPSHHVPPGLLTYSKDTSESVGDDHRLTASETLRRISGRTRTLASSSQVPDARTGTEEDTGAVSGPVGGLKSQEGPGHTGEQSLQVTGIKKEENEDASAQDMPEMWQTLGRSRTVGDEDSVRPGWTLRAETDRPPLVPSMGVQGQHHPAGNTTSQERYKDYAACDILKSMIHYHGQERQDQAPR
ncbi:ZBTB17 [Branchiostoma lanceolatum]|uniref:ZBTB17 protein n=1 Tax=Branchiostoma lanceolatum TaxID=7740 RepID=A0A8J9W4Y7_BRALA|nr:ZBTB17 [Branchiostoma lanceolatum]